MKLEKVYDELYGMIEDLKKQIAAISGGDDVTITPALDSGAKVADYTIGETEGVLYAPLPFTLSTTPQKIGSYGTDDLYAVAFSNASLTSGVNTIGTITNVSDCFILSASIFQPGTGDRIYTNYFGGSNLDVFYSRELSDGDANINVTIGSSLVSAGWTQSDVIALFTRTPAETRTKKKK